MDRRSEGRAALAAPGGAGVGGRPEPHAASRRLLLGLFDEAEPWRIPEAEVKRLARDFPDLEIAQAGSKEELARRISEAEILFSWAPGEETLAQGKALRWLHAPAAGIGAFLTPSVRARGIAVTNSRGVHAVPIAEHVLGMLTALARGLRDAVVEQTTTGMRRDRWWIGSRVPTELRGMTLGLFGYGWIGREVARRAQAFGMRLLALRREPGRALDRDPALLRVLGLPEEEPRVEAVVGPEERDRFLAESDAVVITAPLTPETRGAFDAEAFARMKRGAWLVNVGRGAIVREADLVEALRAGLLSAAALDVFETEPLLRESPLYSLPNVILTPHVSGLSTGFWPRAMALFRENLRRDAEGLPLLNRVDVARGY